MNQTHRYLIGLDIGTTGAKALLVDETGNVCASALEEYPTSQPHPLWVEQNPDDWWRASIRALHRLLAVAGIDGHAVAALGLTGQMIGLVVLDAAGQPLRPCILWNDQRAGAQSQAINAQVGFEQLMALTSNPTQPGFLAPKLLWMREEEPQRNARIAQLLLPKDYVRYRLTGDYATDVTDVSASSFFDVRNRCWSAAMLEKLAIPAAWLPRCVESPAVTGVLTRAAAEAIGLTQGTPVIAGAGDQPAQAVGSGIVTPGLVSVTVGTSGVLFAVADGPAVHPQGHLLSMAHAVPQSWYLMGVMLAAGGSLRWYRDVLGQSEKELGRLTGQDVYAFLTAQAAQAPVGSEGLLFLPYLTGERTPYPDAYARGGWIGLTARHDRRHLVRAVMEGVSFGLRDSLELMRGVGIPVQQIRASGGGARSPFWRQLLADIFGAEIVTMNETEGAPMARRSWPPWARGYLQQSSRHVKRGFR